MTIVGLFFGGCFATVVALASPLEDTLSLRQLWTPLADDALPSRSRIGSPIADALPPLMLDARLVLSGWMLFHRSYIFYVSNHCVNVSFFSQVSRLKFWAKGPSPLLL